MWPWGIIPCTNSYWIPKINRLSIGSFHFGDKGIKILGWDCMASTDSGLPSCHINLPNGNHIAPWSLRSLSLDLGENARNLAFGTAELARIGRLNQYILHVEQIQPCNQGRTLGFNSNGVNLQCPVFVDIQRNPFPVISPMAAMALLSVGSLWLVKALSFLNPACWLVETALVLLEKTNIYHI